MGLLILRSSVSPIMPLGYEDERTAFWISLCASMNATLDPMRADFTDVYFDFYGTRLGCETADVYRRQQRPTTKFIQG
ncbi:Hypothetical protein SMAX5B_015557 [Scophthalmus maximus]|uniref:Uncharacterized protein n=1 Tax=Scophthalmus maximus TaxID=52904 RepID=A0A2U9CYP5_SCOMX|nr:Hypothetical protein SMAX5B_015557 [Scophthalmus maximus]